MMDNDLLYVELKNTLMRSIYEGTLCRRAADSPSVPFRVYGLSRVTVRKNAQLLANQASSGRLASGNRIV